MAIAFTRIEVAAIVARHRAADALTVRLERLALAPPVEVHVGLPGGVLVLAVGTMTALRQAAELAGGCDVRLALREG